MDQLEAAGIVGGFNGAKAREVQISDLNALESFLEELRKQEIMITHTDIKNRISEKFENNSFEVFNLIEEKLKEFDYLNNPRIIRCILFLADNDLEKLKNYIDVAVSDLQM